MTRSNFTTYIERNEQFAATDAKKHVPEIPFIPFKQL
jgi:carbonic anhydrase